MSKKPLDTVFVKPAVAGHLCRKGLGEPFLKQEGEDVELTAYWHRRIRMKDVVVVPAGKSKPVPQPAKPEESKDNKTSKGNKS